MQVHHSFFNEKFVIDMPAGSTIFVCDPQEIAFARVILELVADARPEHKGYIAYVIAQLDAEENEQ